MRPTSTLPRDLKPWAWLWFPPLVLQVQVLVWLIDPAFEQRWIGMREFGAVEIGTILAYLPGIVAGLLALRLGKHLSHPWLRAWLLLFVLGSLCIAGEEASWGQHYLHWNTPEAWAEINKQQETNLHNTSTWLNQKPHIAMGLWILIGGIGMPLRALLCFFIKLPIHLEKWLHLDQPLFSGFNLNKIREYSIAVSPTLYPCSIYVRLEQAANA